MKVLIFTAVLFLIFSHNTTIAQSLKDIYHVSCEKHIGYIEGVKADKSGRVVELDFSLGEISVVYVIKGISRSTFNAKETRSIMNQKVKVIIYETVFKFRNKKDYKKLIMYSADTDNLINRDAIYKADDYCESCNNAIVNQ